MATKQRFATDETLQSVVEKLERIANASETMANKQGAESEITTSDLTTQVSTNTTNIATLTTQVSTNTTSITENSNKIDKLNKVLLENELMAIVEVEQAFTTRQTADGENIVDQQNVFPKLIKGNTVVKDNTFINAKLSGIKSTGRNLISYPYEDGSFKEADGITFTVQPDGGILISGQSYAEQRFLLMTKRIADDVLYVPPGSASATDGKIWLSLFATGVSDIYIAFDISDNSVCVYTGDSLYDNVLVYPMLNMGDTPLPYEPYVEDTLELPETLELGIGDTYNSRTGELKRATKILTFTGDESWTKSETKYSGEYRFLLSLDNVGTTTTDSEKAVAACNLYDIVTAEDTYNIVDGCAVKNNQLLIYDVYYAMEKVDVWKDHLKELYDAGTPLMVAYEIVEPTETSIVNTGKNCYIAWNKGSETQVIDGDIACTVTNDYFIKVGGTTNE